MPRPITHPDGWLAIIPASRYSRAQWERMRQALKLSTRQFQIAQCALHEDKEEAMAARLGLSIHTMHSYRERLYRKLRVRSRAGLVEVVTHALDGVSAG